MLVDRDTDDCKALKLRLEEIARRARFPTRSRAPQAFVVINRIVIEELEAWYFGDWNAVRAAYPRVPPSIPNQASYRDPDAIAGGTWEAFERVLQRAGYFKTGLQKLTVARDIGPHMRPARNTSASFRALRDAIGALTRA